VDEDTAGISSASDQCYAPLWHYSGEKQMKAQLAIAEAREERQHTTEAVRRRVLIAQQIARAEGNGSSPTP
jgi:hypothetical protein